MKDKEREKELDKAKSQMKQLNKLFNEQEKAYKKHTENKQINPITAIPIPKNQKLTLSNRTIESTIQRILNVSKYFTILSFIY